MAPIRKLIAEIHRRSLWQTLGVYLAGSWGALQVIDILVNSLDLPRWLPAGAILLILAGLPITLVTAFIQAGGPRTDEARAGLKPGGASGPDDTEAEARAAPPAFRELFTWEHAFVAGLVAFAVWGVVAAGWLLLGERGGQGGPGGGTVLDAGIVAVFPFHVAGPGDLTFLGEGMVDLLAAKLTGEGSLRAADPRSVMAAWNRIAPGPGEGIRRDAALRLGRSLGAGQVLLGDIVGTPSGLVLNASVFRTEDGELQAQASVEGPTDRLTSLIDQLAVRLLALEAGVEDQRLAELTSLSSSALRAYLDGQAAYRRGGYSEANQHFERALRIDSTFALAALSWVSSAWWSPGFERFNRARETAWALRARLSPRDRALLEAWAGPRYPQSSGWAEHLVRWELAIAAAPERPEPWYESGDIYFHYGPLLGVADSWDRAAARFRRASSLDPNFAAPVGHLLELAAILGDTAEIRSFQRAYAALDSVGDISPFLEWRAAAALGDSVALESIRESFPKLDGASLNRIIGIAQLYGSTLVDADLAALDLAHRIGTRTERWEWLLGLHSLALNRGRPQEARRIMADWEEVEGSPGASQRILVLDALYWDGDMDAATEAVELVMSRAYAPPAPGEDLPDARFADICVAEQWRLWHGDTSTAAASLGQFRSRANPARLEFPPLRHAVCSATIEALLAEAEGRPDAGEYVDRLEALLRLVPDVETGDDPSLIGPFIIANWRESQGDLPGALAAMRRWHNHWFTGVRYLSTFLREEGRLAALTGEQEAAIRAYRHYLMLRSDPDPEWIEERDRVRAELARLTGEATQR